MEIHPDFETFARAYEAGAAQLVWTRLPADLETPVSLTLKLTQAGPDSFLLESVVGASQRGRYSIIGWKPDLIWRCRDGAAEINRSAAFDRAAFEPDAADPLTSLRALLAESAVEIPPELPSSAAGLYGFLGYEMIRLVERLPAPKEDPLDLPDAVLIRPSVVAVVDNAFDRVSFVAPARPTEGVSAKAAYARAAERLGDAVDNLDRPVAPPAREPLPRGAAGAEAQRTGSAAAPGAESAGDDPATVSNTTPERYREMVEIAKRYIRAGDIFQVVPSQRWRRPFGEPPFSFYRALRRTNPSPYMFYFNLGAGDGGPADRFHVVGASPEILVRVSRDPSGARKVTIRPIAGTRRRGADPAEDAALEAELLADPKELAEHLMLLDLGRNDVGRVAKIGTVDPNEQFAIERYSHVMHIVSNVDGELADDEDALSALLAGLPAGTVSGAPKIRAMEIIHELESEKRGVYGGAVGYFAADGEMDTCIALRTAVLKDGALYAQAGGGVVADSDPEAELQETVHKSRALMRAADEAAAFAARGNR